MCRHCKDLTCTKIGRLTILHKLHNYHNKHYKDYGRRGIKVCNEWRNDFMNFYNWAVNNGYDDTLTIDRIDNNKGYSHDNCRWATLKQQARNQRSNTNITINGKTHCLSEWCEIYNINYRKVQSRLKYGWTIEKALELNERGDTD